MLPDEGRGDACSRCALTAVNYVSIVRTAGSGVRNSPEYRGISASTHGIRVK